MTPARMASATMWARSPVPSLRPIRARWLFTVSAESESCSPIHLFDRPSATSRMTSISRLDRSWIVLGMLAAAGLARRPINTPLTPALTASITGPMSAVGANAITRGHPASRSACTTRPASGPSCRLTRARSPPTWRATRSSIAATDEASRIRPTPMSARLVRSGSRVARSGSTTRIVAIRNGVAGASRNGERWAGSSVPGCASSVRRAVLTPRPPEVVPAELAPAAPKAAEPRPAALIPGMELLTGRPPTLPRHCSASPLSGSSGRASSSLLRPVCPGAVGPLSQLVSALRPSVVKHPNRLAEITVADLSDSQRIGRRQQRDSFWRQAGGGRKKTGERLQVQVCFLVGGPGSAHLQVVGALRPGDVAEPGRRGRRHRSAERAEPGATGLQRFGEPAPGDLGQQRVLGDLGVQLAGREDDDPQRPTPGVDAVRVEQQDHPAGRHFLVAAGGVQGGRESVAPRRQPGRWGQRTDLHLGPQTGDVEPGDGPQELGGTGGGRRRGHGRDPTTGHRHCAAHHAARLARAIV